MSNYKRTTFFRVWWPLILFIVVGLMAGIVLMLFNYDDTKNWNVNFIASWDVASSVALSILAFIAYYHHASERQKQYKFLKALEKAKEASEHSSRGAIVIQMGGGNLHGLDEANIFMRQTLSIPDNLIVSKRFGDKDNNVDIDDIAALTHWLQNDCMRLLTHVTEIHVIVSGVGIAFAAITDTLNNWKTLCFYHKNNSEGYQLWYVDKKSLPKNSATDPLKEKV